MKQDLQIFNLIKKEEERQTNGIELIASENYVSDQVLAALGSVCTNKYAEGYKRTAAFRSAGQYGRYDGLSPAGRHFHGP